MSLSSINFSQCLIGNSNSHSTPFLQTLLQTVLVQIFCPQRADVRFVVKTVVSPVSFLVLFSVPNLFHDQELVHIAGDNSATQRGHVSFQLDTDPEAMTLILIPGTVAYFKDTLFEKKPQNIPTQTAFALIKFCSKRRSCDTRSYYCLLYTSPSPRDLSTSRMPSSA